MKLRDAHYQWLDIFIFGAKQLGWDLETFITHIRAGWPAVRDGERHA